MTKRSSNVHVFTNTTVKDQEFRYGWIAFDGLIKTGNASGFPIGTNTSLHRTEMYAILSWIYMTRHLIQMNQNMQFEFNTIIYVTSKTIVKELNPKHILNCMKNAMTDDYDIVNEIKIAIDDIQQLGCKIEIRIVKHKRKK